MFDKAAIRELVAMARTFGPNGNGHAGSDSPDFNGEYTRGQAELIMEAAGLTQDDKPAIIAMITEGTLSACCSHGR